MECNKEEAIRAKGIAEKKMENKDFIGARKIAIRAQQLFSDLENISQMLMVCDVHCSADKKVYGNETDWYGILQIEQTADEATIKKQYRKFALLLHPDKNNFPGAEAAFKLIGEAQRVLLDREKRSTHDMKRRSYVSRPTSPYRPSRQASRCAGFGVQNSLRSNTTSPFTGLNPQPQQPLRQPQPGFSKGSPKTFWTVCPYCAVRYQYYREIINKFLRCQGCQKSFVAYEMNPGVPAGSNVFQSTVPQQKDVRNQGAGREEVGSKGNVSAGNSKRDSFSNNGSTSGVRLEKVNRKRRKQVVESDSFDTGSSSSDCADVAVKQEEVLPTGKKFGSSEEQHVRRSNRQKQNISYKENLSDDDGLVKPPKRTTGNESSCATREETEGAPKKEASKIHKQTGLADDVKNQKEVKHKENACLKESLPNGNKETRNVSKKEKSTDCDSALIPLLCVHG